MKKKIVIGFIITSVIAMMILPVIFIRDSSSLTSEDIACARRDTRIMLDNPFERLFVIKTTADKKEGNTLFTSAYTVVGMKYATVELVCDGGATVTWRRWFKR